MFITLLFLDIEDEDKYLPVNDDPTSNLILEAIKNDELRKVNRIILLQCNEFSLLVPSIKISKMCTKFATYLHHKSAI